MTEMRPPLSIQEQLAGNFTLVIENVITWVKFAEVAAHAKLPAKEQAATGRRLLYIECTGTPSTMTGKAYFLIAMAAGDDA